MDKVALVTGSSRGIGKAIAIELANQGYTLIVHGPCHNTELKITFKEIKKLSPDSICVVADFNKEKDIIKMFRDIGLFLGYLDVLVNNAAIQEECSFLNTSLASWNSVLNVNLTAPFFCSQMAAKLMKYHRGGKIINISSVHDTAPRLKHSSYCVSKAGLVMLTKCMAIELAENHIRVNYLTVGGVDTAMTTPERAEKVIPTIPAKRIAQPKEIAKLVSYLVSSDANFITGSGITIDGGQLLGVWATRKDL